MVTSLQACDWADVLVYVVRISGFPKKVVPNNHVFSY